MHRAVNCCHAEIPYLNNAWSMLNKISGTWKLILFVDYKLSSFKLGNSSGPKCSPVIVTSFLTVIDEFVEFLT